MAALDELFHPRRVAVFGASPDRANLGTRLVLNLQRGGFAGELIAVHPRPGHIGSVRCRPAPEGPLDLALVCVPRERVPEVLETCRHAGARWTVVLAAGFAEGDGQGRDLQQSMTQAGPGVVGPNCLGVLNTRCRQGGRLAATFLERATEVLPGGLSLVSQSGGCLAVVLEEAYRRDLGVAKVVSLGNTAGVTVAQVVEYLDREDEDTRVIGVFAEDAGALQGLPSPNKPLVLLPAGRSAPGRRAARAHTGLPGWEAPPRPAGLAVVTDTGTLADALEVVSRCPPMKGPRVAVVSNSGGLGVAAADACAGTPLRLEPLPEGLRAELGRLLPPYARAGNPLDLGADFNPRASRRVARLLLESGAVDAVILALASCDYAALARALAEPRRLPVAASVVDAPRAARILRQAGVPCLASVEACARALAALWECGEPCWPGGDLI